MGFVDRLMAKLRAFNENADRVREENAARLHEENVARLREEKAARLRELNVQPTRKKDVAPAREEDVARLESHFLVGEAGLPWGVTDAQLTPLFALTEILGGTRWLASCPTLLGLPTLFAVVQESFISNWPVELVMYELDARSGLDARQILAHLEAALGAPAEVSHGRQVVPIGDDFTEYRRWDWSLANLSVSIYAEPQAVHGGTSLGCLRHEPTKARELAWATERWRARGGEDRRWTTEEAGCEAHGFAAENVTLHNHDGPPEPARAREAEILSAKGEHGFAAATPVWIAQHLPHPRDGVVVWFHPAAGKWGIATCERTSVLDVGYVPALEHHLVSPARGPGGAAIHELRGPCSVSTDGDLHALDALVAFLTARLGCAVTVQEYGDV